jgi:hypothetical protein
VVAIVVSVANVLSMNRFSPTCCSLQWLYEYLAIEIMTDPMDHDRPSIHSLSSDRLLLIANVGESFLR